MNDDIVERLREWANRAAQGWDDGPIIGSAELRDAADEVERLRAAGDNVKKAWAAPESPEWTANVIEALRGAVFEEDR